MNNIISKDRMKELREIPILDVAKLYFGASSIKQRQGTEYYTLKNKAKNLDLVINISQNKFYENIKQVGGVNSIDFLTKFLDMNFQDACSYLEKSFLQNKPQSSSLNISKANAFDDYINNDLDSLF